jgi:hypothetical protein
MLAELAGIDPYPTDPRGFIKLQVFHQKMTADIVWRHALLTSLSNPDVGEKLAKEYLSLVSPVAAHQQEMKDRALRRFAAEIDKMDPIPMSALKFGDRIG